MGEATFDRKARVGLSEVRLDLSEILMKRVSHFVKSQGKTFQAQGTVSAKAQGQVKIL